MILASISIGALFSEKGIIKQAQESKRQQEEAKRLEEENLNELLGEYKNSMEGNGFSNNMGSNSEGGNIEGNSTNDNTTGGGGNTGDTGNESNHEAISGAMAPKLSDGMIPVKWDSNNKYWVKTIASDTEWYNYNEKKWANVVLKDSTFISVAGEEILDEDANYSMLVWIPRYAYKITSMYHKNGTVNTSGNIEIVFVDSQDTNVITGTKYTRNSKTLYPEATIGESMSDYVVHPAFDFGDKKLTGFWAGKYDSSNTEQRSIYNGIDKTVMIKANVEAWKGVTISNIFDICLEINKEGNIYGLNTSDSVVDPHLIKNDEWGAIAYLSKSKYGIETREVLMSYGKTGHSGSTTNHRGKYYPSTTYAYNTGVGALSSTTGNTTGIYDISGGNEDYVAAYVNNGNSYLTTYGSSLVNAAAKYKNVYTRGSTDAAANNYAVSVPANGNYGDAIYEISNAGSRKYNMVCILV